MSSLLTNCSFLSPLKRQRAVRNRGNNATTPTPSKRANRLPVLPELAAEQELFSSPLISSLSSAFISCPSSPNKKRLSRYGRDQFTSDRAPTVAGDSPSTAPRTARRVPSSPKKPMRQSVRLSALDIIVDISTSEPASPISETSFACSTPPRRRDARPSFSPQSCSPTPSLTSVSACSSTEMPTTPGASDDEWPGLRAPGKGKAIAQPSISRHPLVAIKSTPSLSTPGGSPAQAFEFTLESFFGLEDEEEEEYQEEEEEEEDMLWYSHEMSQVISFSSPSDPSTSPARRDSLLPPSRGSSSNTDRRSGVGKSLPTIPGTPSPISQLDPTFPRSKSHPSRRAPRTSSLAALPPQLDLSAPVAPPEPRKLPAPPSSATSRRPLPITVPRALPRTPVPLDVSDILDDFDAWSFASPPTSTSTLMLSPPRLPRSPASSLFSDEYDPIELIVSYATQPSSPATPSTPTITNTVGAATFPEDEDELAKAEVDNDDNDNDDDKRRWRWSCSTLATTLSQSGSPPHTPTFASTPPRLHLGSVARRMRGRRNINSGSNGSEDALAVVAVHVRSSSESALI